jgi:hypothetical protein
MTRIPLRVTRFARELGPAGNLARKYIASVSTAEVENIRPENEPNARRTGS